MTCQRETLDANGMVVDFTKIKETVNQLDHVLINDVVGNLKPYRRKYGKVDLRPHSVLRKGVGRRNGRKRGCI